MQLAIPKQHKHAERRFPIGNLSKKQLTNDDNPGNSNSNRFEILDAENNIDGKGQETTGHHQFFKYDNIHAPLSLEKIFIINH